MHYYKESNAIKQTNSKNNQMMKQLLKAKCGVSPVMKGPDGWEKHAAHYYNLKTSFENRTKKRMSIRKSLKDHHLGRNDDYIEQSFNQI